MTRLRVRNGQSGERAQMKPSRMEIEKAGVVFICEQTFATVVCFIVLERVDAFVIVVFSLVTASAAVAATTEHSLCQRGCLEIVDDMLHGHDSRAVQRLVVDVHDVIDDLTR